MNDRILSAEHLEAFRDHLLWEEKSAATIEKYLRDAGTFLKFAPGQRVTKEKTIAYKQDLQDRGYLLQYLEVIPKPTHPLGGGR